MNQFLSDPFNGALTACVIILLIATIFTIRGMSKQEQEDNKDAERTVTDIIRQSRWDVRQRFVNENTVEFVYLVLGNETTHIIWVRIIIGMTAPQEAIVCYIPDLAMRHRDFAYALVREFNKQQGWKSRREVTSIQPKEWETGVDENIDIESN